MGGYLEEPKAPRANISPLLHHVKTTPAASACLGTKPKRTVVRNQSSNYAKTLQGEYSAASVFLGTKPKRTVVCNQSSNYAKTLKGEYSTATSLPWYEP